MRATIVLAKAALVGAALALLPTLAVAQQTVRIGLGAPTLSFLPIWAARALDTFKPQGLSVTAVALPGGDASALGRHSMPATSNSQRSAPTRCCALQPRASRSKLSIH